MGQDEPGYADDRFRAIFEAALDGMLVTDDERRYVDVNPAACRLLGRRRDELLRLRIEDVSAPSGDLEAAWTSFLRTGTMAGEYSLLQPGGSTIDVEFRATANVVPGRHLSVIRDVTSRKRLERDLRMLNEELREARDRERSIASTSRPRCCPGREHPRAPTSRPATSPHRRGSGCAVTGTPSGNSEPAASAWRWATSWGTACRPPG